MAPKWTVRQDRGSWWATIVKGPGAPVGVRIPVILIHPKGDERGSGIDWRAKIYSAVRNANGAWWQKGGFDQAVSETDTVLLRRSLGHDQDGHAIAGGPKIGVFTITNVSSSDERFSFSIVDRIADVE